MFRLIAAVFVLVLVGCERQPVIWPVLERHEEIMGQFGILNAEIAALNYRINELEAEFVCFDGVGIQRCDGCATDADRIRCWSAILQDLYHTGRIDLNCKIAHGGPYGEFVCK